MSLFFRKKKNIPTAPRPQSAAGRTFAFLIVGVMSIAAISLAVRQHVPVQGEVTIGNDTKVRVTVASTEPTRARGLSGRRNLAADEGMLFIFDAPDKYHFWMKEMRFSIDVLWIANGSIVDITTDLPIPTPGEQFPLFGPKVPVDRALEVPAGFARAHGLKLGMPVQYVDSRGRVR